MERRRDRDRLLKKSRLGRPNFLRKPRHRWVKEMWRWLPDRQVPMVNYRWVKAFPVEAPNRMFERKLPRKRGLVSQKPGTVRHRQASAIPTAPNNPADPSFRRPKRSNRPSHQERQCNAAVPEAPAILAASGIPAQIRWRTSRPSRRRHKMDGWQR